MINKINIIPDNSGFFGEFGGQYLPQELKQEFQKITDTFLKLKEDKNFLDEYHDLLKHYSGRPTPTYFAKNLSEKYGNKIFLKREDLNHTGAHKINHCLGEALLAKKMGKTKIIAETGAGQHGVATATAAALLNLKCDIYMGEVDIKKEKPNVDKMRLLGANVIPAKTGARTLKEAVDEAFLAYIKEFDTALYAIGSVVGPHPFPMMVEYFQSIVGFEAKEQFLELTKTYPNNVVACVGGGSNAIGIFNGFIDNSNVKLFGIEPLGKSEKVGENAASITFGKKGQIHGFDCLLLQDSEGNPTNAYSIASGLDYPGVGPKHCYLNEIKRVKYETILDNEALQAFYELTRLEGIIPALESSHAVAYAIKLAKKLNEENKKETILVNLSGRGDKDIDFILENYKD